MERKTKLWILVGIIFLILYISLLVFIIWRNPAYDKDCLAEIGFDYCKNNNLTWHRVQNQNSFYCKSYEDSRTKQGDSFEYFYFLEEEMESCIKRRAKSWEKLR